MAGTTELEPADILMVRPVTLMIVPDGVLGRHVAALWQTLHNFRLADHPSEIIESACTGPRAVHLSRAQ